MNAHLAVRPPSHWHVGRWFARLHRLLGKPGVAAPRVAAAPPTRRQQLLAAQELKKGEQRLRMLALLREVKRKGRGEPRDPHPPHRITGN